MRHRATSSWFFRICLVVALLVGGTPAPSGGESATAAPVADIVSDADWVLESTFPDGAIAQYHDGLMVQPYFAHFAAIGLVHASKTTGDRRYIDAAWGWLSWYQRHMDAQGYVTDYSLVNGVLTSTGGMDSTDSYAGMFLVAVYHAHRASADAAKTIALRTGIAKAVGAIESTMQADGLTWAKPTWRVKYLMDQAETYGGLRSAAWIARNVLNDPILAARADGHADRMRAGVATLWNGATGAYDWAKFEGGDRQPTNWVNLYSDAMQQVWAVAFGLVDDDQSRAPALLDRFSATHPSWDRPAATDQIQGVSDAVGYWPVAAWAFSRQGHQQRANEAMANIRAAALDSGRAWPFTTAVQGQLLYLEASASDLFPSTSGTGSVPATTVDAQPPTPPRISAVLRAMRSGRRAVDLTWTRSADNVGVACYRLYRNGSLLTTVSSLAFRDSAVSKRRSNSYVVVAVDAAGNRSPSSNVVTILT